MDTVLCCGREKVACAHLGSLCEERSLPGAARLAVFLVLALAVAFSGPAVLAQGEAPELVEGSEGTADPSGEIASDSSSADPMAESVAPTTPTTTPDEGGPPPSTSEPEPAPADAPIAEAQEAAVTTEATVETAPSTAQADLPTVDAEPVGADPGSLPAGSPDPALIDPLTSATGDTAGAVLETDAPAPDPQPILVEPDLVSSESGVQAAVLDQPGESADTRPLEPTSQPDPQFCASGDPATGTCADLRTRIMTDGSTPGALEDVDQPGTIYLEIDATFDESLVIDAMPYDLTFSGGWDFDSGSSGSFTPGDTSVLNGPISILDATGTIRFENIIFGASALLSVQNSCVEIAGTDGNDTLQITAVGASSVTADGADGSDSYTVNLTGGGGAPSVVIHDTGTGPADMDELLINGTAADDTLEFGPGTVSAGAETVTFSGIEVTRLDGQSGMDRLVGPDTATLWEIVDDDAGQVSGLLFTSFESLTGGSGDDTFRFSDGKGLTGSIDGGLGENTLDYSGYATPVVVNLNAEVVSAGGAPRPANSATGVGGGIANILNVTGGLGDDVLIGTGYGGTLLGGPGGVDVILSSGPQLLIGALKMLLRDLQQDLFSSVFGNAIPVIGDALSKACDAAAVCPGAVVDEYILAALEDGGFNNENVTDATSFLNEVASALGDLLLTSPISVAGVYWVTMGKTNDQYEIPFGTGLAGLPLSIGAPGEDPPAVIGLTLTWTLELKFGSDAALGFFVMADKLLSVDVDASFLDQEPHLGSLGLFQAKIQDGVSAPGGGAQLSRFVGTYTARLSGAGPLYGTDLLEAPVEGRLTSTVSQIYLTIAKAAFVLDENFELPADIPGLFNMALRTEVSILWDFNNADTSVSHGSFGDVPSVVFEEIYLDPGPFFSQILAPYIKGIQAITLPIQPILDILLAPIPILSDFGLLPGTVLELLGANPGMVTAVELIHLINNITFGSGDCLGGTEECVWIAIGDGFGVTDPRVVAAGITSPEPLFGEWQPTWQTESERYGFSPILAGELFGADAFDFFDFPILEDPNEIYRMILGIQGRFFTINLPEMSLNFQLPQSLKACLWQMLCVRFYGDIGLTAGPIEFGYDSKGISDFLKAGSADLALLADGFYIADLCRVNGGVETCPHPYPEGAELERVPLVELYFNVGAALSLGIDLKIFAVEGGVQGGVEGSIRFNLHDGMIGLPDDGNLDGRIRGSEIGWNAALGWTCVFDISGEIEAYLQLYIEVSTDLGLFEITWYEDSWDIARITLVEFCQSCEGLPPALAHLEGGVLVLHTGTDAGDLTGLASYSINEYFAVTHAGGAAGSEILMVSAYGFAQTFEGVSSIEADAGAGNDKIVIGSGVTSDALLLGGSGDDTLVCRGSGECGLYGGAGNDLLKGGSGQNYLYGSQSYPGGPDGDTDTPSRIWIEPDEQNHIGIYDEINDEWLGYWERQFNDQLFGGSGENWLYGGMGDDKLFGGPGTNHLYGEQGSDVLSAGQGPNYMYGGRGNDSFIWTSGAGVTQVDGGLGSANLLFVNLKSSINELTVEADGSTGQVSTSGAHQLSFEQIQEMTINPDVGIAVTIEDLFSTTLKTVYVNTKAGGSSLASTTDTISVYGGALGDQILVDTQPLDDSNSVQAAHVGFCAGVLDACPATGGESFLLELFIANTSVSEGDRLFVDGGPGDDFFQVRPGPQSQVEQLTILELRGGPDWDTVLGLDTPNTWTMTATDAGNLNGQFTFVQMEGLVGGDDFDTLIGPSLASTFRMVSDFDGVLNEGLYYFSMEKLIGGSSSDTLVGSNDYNFWSLLAVNDGQLFRFAGPQGLMAMLEDLQASQLFVNSGIYKSLRNRLQLAIQETEKGRAERAAMEMWAFVQMLDDVALRGQVALPGDTTLAACDLSASCRVGGSLQYVSFENLTGGAGDDFFAFEDGMGVTGWIDGAPETDALDYAKYSTNVQVSVSQGYATGSGGVSNIERVMGRGPARRL